MDSLTFIDPAYQAERIDSVTFGEINYSAASKLIFLEASTYYDIAIRRRLKLYSGFILGFGCGFDNTFTVSRYKEYYIAKKNGNSGTAEQPVKETFQEPKSMSFRFIIPAGLQLRFNVKKKYALGAFGELRLGNQIYKVKGEKPMSTAILGINVGLRYYFDYFK